MKSKLYSLLIALALVHSSLTFTYLASEGGSERELPGERGTEQTYQINTERVLPTEALEDQALYAQDPSLYTAPHNQFDTSNPTTSSVFTLPKTASTESRITTENKSGKIFTEVSALTLSDISTGIIDAQRLNQELAHTTDMHPYYQELAQQATQHASKSLETTLRLFNLLNNYNSSDAAARATLSNTFKTAFDEARQACDKAYTALAKSPESQATSTASDLANLAYKTLSAFKKVFDMGQKLDKDLTYSINYLLETTLDEAKYLNQQF